MTAAPPADPDAIDYEALFALDEEVAALDHAGQLDEYAYRRIWEAAVKAAGGQESELETIRMYARPGWPGFPN